MFTNSFSPHQKMMEKMRDGAKVKKRYDGAKTSYRRIMDDSDLDSETKKRLERQYLMLNPVTIRKEMLELAGG